VSVSTIISRSFVNLCFRFRVIDCIIDAEGVTDGDEVNECSALSAAERRDGCVEEPCSNSDEFAIDRGSRSPMHPTISSTREASNSECRASNRMGMGSWQTGHSFVSALRPSNRNIRNVSVDEDAVDVRFVNRCAGFCSTSEGGGEDNSDSSSLGVFARFFLNTVQQQRAK